MPRIELVMTWFNRMRRADDRTLRRIERLGQDHPSPRVPLFFAQRN